MQMPVKHANAGAGLNAANFLFAVSLSNHQRICGGFN
jgi:hypothetical protein